MSRQNIYARNNFFKQSMQKAQTTRKKKKDIKSLQYGNMVVPDPKNGVIETEDSVEQDLEVVEDE